jgi:hypothetical protein
MPLKKQSVEYIASIEHLDQPLTVVSIKGWIFLLFSLLLSLAILLWVFLGTITLTASGKSIIFNRAGMLVVNSPSAGIVTAINVQEGQLVKKNQVIMVLQDTSQRDTQVITPDDGVITAIKVSLGENVTVRTALTLLQRNSNPGELKVYGFIPMSSASSIRPGMQVNCVLNGINHASYGMLRGVVKEVIPYPVSLTDATMQEIPSGSLRDYLIQGSVPSQLVIIDPILDSNTTSGFAWTTKEGPPSAIEPGMVGSVYITLEKVSPISYLIPATRKK